MERLGLGPDVCLARNPKLVFGRMTGWGQDGPVRRRPPATTSTTSRWPARWPTSGAPGEAPVPPLNLVGDFGGGGMFLAFGVVCALLEAQTQRPGPGRRRGHGRRRGGADDACSGRSRRIGDVRRGRAGHEPARHRRALLRRLRVRRRQVRLDRLDRAAVLRRAAAPHRARRRPRVRQADGPDAVAGRCKAAPRRGLRAPRPATSGAR